MTTTWKAAGAAVALGMPAAVAAQGVPPGPRQATADIATADIVVTGLRGQPRTVVDSPTPIDVISQTELSATGRPGLISNLSTLVPSFNAPTRAGGGTSTVIATGGLRGLNPDQTLVLVNGKRRHKTSLINAVSTLYSGSVPVDLNLIPESSIARIEVLRDGAAAQYGSDAIAGVINIILADTREGGFATASAGQNFDRSDGELYQAGVHVGQALGPGFVTFTANGRIQEASNRALPIAGNIRLYPLVGGQPDPREATIDRLITTNYGAMPQRTLVLGWSGAYPLGEAELYSFGTWAQRRSDLNYTFRTPANVNTLPEIFPNGFRPRVIISELDFAFALGARGVLAGWDWDLSSNFGRNRSRQNADQTLNPTLGPTSPTEFFVGTLRSNEWVNSLDLTQGFAWRGNLQLSSGLQHRREQYAVLQGEPASYAAGPYVRPDGRRPAPGAQAAQGFQPDDEGRLTRNSFGVYAEAAWDPSDDITIGAATRFETYDDASGDTLIGKLSGRWQFVPWAGVRGSASTGFRAPSLAQQIYASTTGQFRTVGNVTNVLLNIKTLPVGSPSAIALGAVPLVPETSVNVSAGVVLTPLAGLNATIDVYQIDVDDRIAITSTLTGPAVSAILVANGLSPDISAQYYTNAIDTRTRGIDVTATWRTALAGLGPLTGDLRLTGGYNYNETTIRGIIPNPPELVSLGAGFVLFDRLSQGNLTSNYPRSRVLLGALWSSGPFTLNARTVRYGGFTNRQNNPAMDRRFGPQWITDVEASWQIAPALSLAIGADNVFNVYPDANAQFNANLGQGQYPTTTAYGFTGGRYYARLGVRF